MKRLIATMITLLPLLPAVAQGQKEYEADSLLTAERCAEMAIANNAAMRNAAKNVESARETRRELLPNTSRRFRHRRRRSEPITTYWSMIFSIW